MLVAYLALGCSLICVVVFGFITLHVVSVTQLIAYSVSRVNLQFLVLCYLQVLLSLQEFAQCGSQNVEHCHVYLASPLFQHTSSGLW